MPERQLFAAVDLGSNSFHMIVARLEHGELRVIDRIRDMVRLAGGLSDGGQLAPAVREEALACLARFGQRIQDIPEHQVRAVGTQTFRRLRNPAAFLVIAETALGCPIDIISGREEARLVYLGVSQGIAPSSGARLVIDIGGGSTEIVSGHTQEPSLAESLPYGCVSVSRSAFPNGRITSKRWTRASREIQSELQAHAPAFRRYGWDQAVGSSGTVRSVASMLNALYAGDEGPITPQRVAALKERMLQAGHVDKLDLAGLSERRRPVIAGGVVVLEAVMTALGIEALRDSPFALREGLLHDLLGRLEDRDPRDTTVAAMAERHQIDQLQSARVRDWAMTAFEQVAENWALNSSHRDLLHWVCQLHELGLAIAHDAYHQHTAYVLEHGDMAGFSRQEQQFMAVLARLQRGRLNPADLDGLPQRLRASALKLLCLLRLAVCFCRARSDASVPDFAVSAGPGALRLMLAEGWLDAHPLTRRGLEVEQQQLARLDITLSLATLVDA